MKAKKLFGILLPCVCLSLASCSSEMKPLTESDVVNSVEEFHKFDMKNYSVASVVTGYYELNSEVARLELRKMQAAGLINYKVEYYEEEVKRYYYTYKEEHYVVSVSLTEEGKKYEISEEDYEKMQKEMVENLVDDELKGKNDDKEYPEDNVGPEVISNLPAKKDTSAASSNTGTTTAKSSVSSTSTNANMEMSAYDRVKAKFNEKKVYVKLFKYDVVKARKVRCTPEMMKKGIGNAEVIMEYVDVTPFGRILGKVKDGQRIANRVQLDYYQDKGWVYEDNMVVE